jgi:repressor LexA
MNHQSLHPLQEKILHLAQERNIATLKLREIGRLVGDLSPQKIKHHIQQLEKRGLLKIDRDKKIAKRTGHGWIGGFLKKGRRLLRIPIVGAANCGPAEILADQNTIGYLRISNALLGQRKTSEGLFAIRASGFSMNQTRVNEKNIDDGDLLIIDGNDRVPRDGQVILSVIDGSANVKRYHEDADNQQLVLMSDSTEDFAPIFIHEDDDFFVNGRVIDVVKRPKTKG